MPTVDGQAVAELRGCQSRKRSRKRSRIRSRTRSQEFANDVASFFPNNYTVASFPRWSRAFHGSPAGFKFTIENASMNFYLVRVQELLVLEADAILMRSRGGASWVHVRQELCFSADCGHLLFVTCGDTPTAFATFHAATGWFMPCPIQVDARGVREVIARWIVAPPRGSRGDRRDVRA